MRNRGFTLVELIVVIGIIALLISVLMPALSRARSSAVNIDCMSRMRQIGQVIHTYAGAHRGKLPPSLIGGADRFEVTNETGNDHMPSTLTRAMGKVVKGKRDWSPLFRDRDVKEVPLDPISGWYGVQNNYNFHPRLFVPLNHSTFLDMQPRIAGGTDVKFTQLRSITRSKESSKLIAAWDAVNFRASTGALSWGNNAYYFPDQLRDEKKNYIWSRTRSMMLGISYVEYDLKIDYQDQYDRTQAGGGVDWRHLGRKSANVLMLDGHVESRKRGDLIVRDFCLVRP